MIKNSYLKSLFALLTLISLKAYAQPEEEGIKTTVSSLFTGMKNADTNLVRNAFAPGAIMQTIVKNKEGKVSVHSEPVDSFISFIGKPHKDVYDERIHFSVIKIDGELAVAWTPYQFYLNDKFLHCGVNSFQLVKLNGSWKILYIVDTRRRVGCE